MIRGPKGAGRMLGVAPDLIERIEATSREHMLSQMPQDPGEELAAMELGALTIAYGTWRSRLIPAQPRECHVSAELAASPKAVEHGPALDAIIDEIEAGTDLRAHLSRRVKTAHQSGAEGERLGNRRDRDLLVADWGIHHLHLTITVQSDGYVGRSGDLLFGVFTASDAFLIGIYPHGSWGLKEMLEILARNWPDDGPMHRLRGVVGLTQEWGDRELMQLRAAGIATAAVMIDGEAWTPAAIGQTLGGTPLMATQRGNALMHTLRDWREHLEGHLAEAGALANAAAGREVCGDWEPMVHEEWVGIVRDRDFYRIAQLS